MRIKSRLPIVIGFLALTLIFSSTIWVTWLPFRFVKNYSVSEKPGLYIVNHQKTLKKGDLVLVSFPKAAKIIAKERAWLREDIPLLKRIAGVESDLICHRNGKLTINGVETATILTKDRMGEEIRGVKGCYTIEPGYFLPVNTHSPFSFDGRYFGPISYDFILGAASPLWIF